MLKLFSVIFLSLLSVTLFSQESNIRGKVTDNNGEPLIGVSIIVKGSSNGTITDIEGEFQLSVDPTQTLVLSMVGMETLELGIANRSYIEAIMSESTDVLEEVVGRLLNHTPLSITGQRYVKPSLDALRPSMEKACEELETRVAKGL